MDNTEILKWNQKSKSQKHHFFLPSPSLRALIIGSSNCGKTCLLLKLLLTEKWLDYNDENRKISMNKMLLFFLNFAYTYQIPRKSA